MNTLCRDFIPLFPTERQENWPTKRQEDWHVAQARILRLALRVWGGPTHALLGNRDWIVSRVVPIYHFV